MQPLRVQASVNKALPPTIRLTSLADAPEWRPIRKESYVKLALTIPAGRPLGNYAEGVLGWIWNDKRPSTPESSRQSMGRRLHSPDPELESQGSSQQRLAAIPGRRLSAVSPSRICIGSAPWDSFTYLPTVVSSFSHWRPPTWQRQNAANTNLLRAVSEAR